jgi:hypothetical protein
VIFHKSDICGLFVDILKRKIVCGEYNVWAEILGFKDDCFRTIMPRSIADDIYGCNLVVGLLELNLEQHVEPNSVNAMDTLVDLIEKVYKYSTLNISRCKNTSEKISSYVDDLVCLTYHNKTLP